LIPVLSIRTALLASVNLTSNRLNGQPPLPLLPDAWTFANVSEDGTAPVKLYVKLMPPPKTPQPAELLGVFLMKSVFAEGYAARPVTVSDPILVTIVVTWAVAPAAPATVIVVVPALCPKIWTDAVVDPGDGVLSEKVATVLSALCAVKVPGFAG